MSAKPPIFGGVFAQHLDPVRSHNDDLAQARISDPYGTFEFWHHEIPLTQISEAEKALIRISSPLTNKIRYTRLPL
jgi:hypothetical protein